MLEELDIHNYKSIRNVKLKELPSFAVFVGANASGKTNFVDALDFLALTFKNGLPSAISAKGGYQNIVYRRGKPARGGISFHIKVSLPPIIPPKRNEREKFSFIYDFKIVSKTEAIRSQYLVKSEYIKISQGATSLLEINRDDDKIDVVNRRNETLF